MEYIGLSGAVCQGYDVANLRGKVLVIREGSVCKHSELECVGV